MFWSGKWAHIKDFERSAHIMVVFFSWIGLLLKVVVVFSIGLLEWANIRSSLPSKLQEKLTGPNYVEHKDEA
jgi:hypothetical protein